MWLLISCNVESRLLIFTFFHETTSRVKKFRISVQCQCKYLSKTILVHRIPNFKIGTHYLVEELDTQYNSCAYNTLRIYQMSSFYYFPHDEYRKIGISL